MLLGPSTRQGAGGPLRTRGVTLAALMVAAAVLLVYLAVTVLTNRLFFLGASSLVLYILALEAGAGMAVLATAAAALLVFLLLPVGPWTLAFWGFFGPYAVVKYGVERLRLRPLAWAIKLLGFNLCLGLALAVLPQPLEGAVGGWAWPRWQEGFGPPLPGWAGSVPAAVLVLLVAANAVFLIYDWALSYFGSYWVRRLARQRRP